MRWIEPPAFILSQSKFQLRQSCPWTSNRLVKWLRARKWSLRRLGVKSLLTSRDRWNCWECAYGYDFTEVNKQQYRANKYCSKGTNQRRHLRPWIGVDRFPPNRSSYNEQNRREWWAAPCSSPPSGTNPCAPFWKPRWCLLSNPQQYSKWHKLKDPRYIYFSIHQSARIIIHAMEPYHEMLRGSAYLKLHVNAPCTSLSWSSIPICDRKTPANVVLSEKYSQCFNPRWKFWSHSTAWSQCAKEP